MGFVLFEMMIAVVVFKPNAGVFGGVAKTNIEEEEVGGEPIGCGVSKNKNFKR